MVWGDTFCLCVCLSRGYYLVTNLIISFTICLYIDVILILILYDAVRQYIVTSLSHQCCSLAATFIYARINAAVWLPHLSMLGPFKLS